MIGPGAFAVRETLFENRYPADNHDKYAAYQSRKKENFNKMNRQNDQRVSHFAR